MVVGLNLLPGALAVLLTGTIVAATSLRVGSGPVLVAVALLGLPFLQAAAEMISLTPTVLVMGLDVVLLFLAVKASPALLARPAYRGVRRFLAWWLAFLLIYSLFSFTTDLSSYSVFSWQYLAVYGSYYALAGVLAIRNEVSPPEAMAIGLPLFAFNYWLLESSVDSIAMIVDATIGLRGAETFNAIDSARMAGLLLLMSLAVIFTDRHKQRRVPEIAAAIVLAAPLAWYAYTRQVYVTVVVVAACMAVVMVFRSRVRGESIGGRLILVSVVCVLGATAAWQIFDLFTSNVESRIALYGVQSNSRIELWTTSLQLISNNPVSGIGIGEFQRRGFGSWPHNWIIEAWLGLGLPGLILVLIGAGVVVLALLRRSEAWLGGWLYMGLYYLFVAQVSADIARNAPLLFFIVLAFHAMAASGGCTELAQQRAGLPRR
ncbi:hypothetical protein ACG33_07425 [Steroidobacter denitrificans]|uniref:O-antigen ligase-related domain-containing protein n=2 Tax=Steroidobacter denitrificans TaxID=465721 RepID=A0A127FBF0_STEDE|nr:hypothetical protein ACG33_07425 [Steroidobacter denitrificans]